jgi:hypothetical protein
MEQFNSLESENENDQLITPARTPVDEDYRKPFQADEVGRRRYSGRSTPRNDAVEVMLTSRDDVRSVTIQGVRKRSVTLPSSSSLQASPSPAATPRSRKALSSHLDGASDDVPEQSAADLTKLTSTYESLPIRAVTPPDEVPVLSALRVSAGTPNGSPSSRIKRTESHLERRLGEPGSRQSSPSKNKEKTKLSDDFLQGRTKSIATASRPQFMNRSITAPFPPNLRRHSTADRQGRTGRIPERPRIITPADSAADEEPSRLREAARIPDTASLPLPPFSIPTHLHLELSSERPSPLYIQTSDMPYGQYESSKVKLERLLNFLLIPPQLEQVLLFGALTCLDSWLYTFTILPLRFIRASIILLSWIVGAFINEIMNSISYAYARLARTWQRRTTAKEMSVLARADSDTRVTTEPVDSTTKKTPPAKPKLRTRASKTSRQRRSTPSLLGVNHKADLLQGLLIVFSCILLMQFDASRIYHAIRGQSAMKLYVIYNVLEVFDRLFSALGQDIIECLFSAEVLERKPNGRSRVFRPFWMFLLALVYTVLHAMAFFYQVITLNVAVNSYSNALLTLLMSNQFVEIKGTVFKKIEKENLFQLTCADVVERFQLWLMLLIIALRNIVELGGLSVPSGDFAGPSSSGGAVTNATSGVPFRTFGILPNSFTILPSLVPAQVLVPFLVVLGSEMLVDWVKHAYITKFNAMSPTIYGRYLDVLAKDYYTNAFAEQNLMRRLGLPVIPLACLFIRAALQTYHMFLATNVPAPLPSATTTLALDVNTTASPVIAQIDNIFRKALGRSSFGGATPASGFAKLLSWTLDDAIAFVTMLVFFVALYLVLLVCKLILGMVLLRFARDRYKGMKARERETTLITETKRLGGWGTVELGDDRRKIIYEGDEAGLRKMRDRDQAFREAESRSKKTLDLDKVDRYSMIAKRIW